jgi:regulator of protease activity HflC (stomatin/prohibitin superfamily)
MKIFKIESIVALVVLGLVVLAILKGGYYTVNPGEVAVKIRLGKLVDSYGEGLYFKIPIVETVEKFSIRINRADIKTESFSKDLQPIDLEVVVNHRIEKNTVESIYRNLGSNYETTVVEPIVQEEIKAVISKFSAESLISNRTTVTAEISNVVKARLLKKEIIITDISVTNFDFTDAFLKSVEDKQIAEQQAKKAKKDVERVKSEAQQKLEQAKVEAEALRLQRLAVSPNLIKLRSVEAQIKAIEKWDGKLPNYVGGGTVPFIGINGTPASK